MALPRLPLLDIVTLTQEQSLTVAVGLLIIGIVAWLVLRASAPVPDPHPTRDIEKAYVNWALWEGPEGRDLTIHGARPVTLVKGTATPEHLRRLKERSEEK